MKNVLTLYIMPGCTMPGTVMPKNTIQTRKQTIMNNYQTINIVFKIIIHSERTTCKVNKVIKCIVFQIHEQKVKNLWKKLSLPNDILHISFNLVCQQQQNDVQIQNIFTIDRTNNELIH